jgi:hypothetical protein
LDVTVQEGGDADADAAMLESGRRLLDGPASNELPAAAVVRKSGELLHGEESHLEMVALHDAPR